MNHECIKCRATYQDTDTEAYLCASCQDAKRAIAAQVDAQFATRPRTTVKSDLQIFEENGKSMTIEGRTVTFNRA